MTSGEKHSSKYIKLCPICNSVDVSPNFSVPAAVASGALYSYRCNRCGFVGLGFPEVPVDDVPEPRNFQDVEKGYTVLDVTYGRGYINLMKYIAPFGVILSIVFYLESKNLLNLLGVVIFSYLTFYIFGGRYFGRYRFLKFVGLVALILYALFYRIV
jgi:hypothetical protein